MQQTVTLTMSIDELKSTIGDVFEQKIKELNQQPETRVLSRKEAWTKLGISQSTFDAMVRSGQIKVKRAGNRVLVPESSIADLLNSDGFKIKHRKNK